MNLIFSYSPSTKDIRLVYRNDFDNQGKEMMEQNISVHGSDEIIIELNNEAEAFLKQTML